MSRLSDRARLWLNAVLFCAILTPPDLYAHIFYLSLTLALMGSDDLNLRVLSTSSDNEKERKSATKVLRLLSRGRHWVLVVLLLSNVVSVLPPIPRSSCQISMSHRIACDDLSTCET